MLMVTSVSAQSPPPTVCEPRLVQVSTSKTVHSESSADVPADDAQSPMLPQVTSEFLTRVWSAVALVTPATSQPAPGSSVPQSPTQSKIVKFVSSPRTTQ